MSIRGQTAEMIISDEAWAGSDRPAVAALQQEIDRAASSIIWGQNAFVRVNNNTGEQYLEIDGAEVALADSLADTPRAYDLDRNLNFVSGQWSIGANMETHIRDPFEEFKDELQALRDEIAQLKMLLLEN